MNKKNRKIVNIVVIVLAVVMLLTYIAPLITAFAAVDGVTPDVKLYDFAELLTDEEYQELSLEAVRISQEYKYDVVVVLTDEIGSSTAEAYADDFFDYNGFGYGDDFDGMLLLVSMEDRDVHISTCGRGIQLFSDARIDRMLDNIAPKLGDRDYGGAVDVFLSMTEDTLKNPPSTGSQGPSLTVSSSYIDMDTVLFVLFICFFITAIVMAILYLMHHKSFASPPAARAYLVGNVDLRHQSDNFMHTHTTRTKIETDSRSSGGGSSSHSSSSGRSHGGGGRKF